MSSANPRESSNGDDGGRPSRLKRLLKKARSILRREKPSKGQSAADTAPAVAAKDEGEGSSKLPTAPTTSATTPGAETASQPSEQLKAFGTAPEKPPSAVEATKTNAATTSSPPPLKPSAPSHKTPVTAADSHRIQIEKARILFAKYNLTLSDDEWTPPFRGDFPRVEKKIRMRIRRHCHRCETSFGADKLCKQCGHTRCKKCPKTSSSLSSATSTARSVARDGKGKIIRRNIVTGGESVIVGENYRAMAPSLDPLAGPSPRERTLDTDPDRKVDVSAQAKAA